MNKVGKMASNLIGSEILKISNEINKLKSEGKEIYNFTIGDFDPQIYPIPQGITDRVIQAYNDKLTNYPPGMGELKLRKSISKFHHNIQGINYDESEIQVSCGTRPLIYGIYNTILDPDDGVIYSVPSWNNNHYCHLVGATPIEISTDESTNFMMTDEHIKKHIKNANLIVINSPLNPTGTMMSRDNLLRISKLIVQENIYRESIGQKLVYLLYDQVYGQIIFNDTHYNPISLLPEMKKYTIILDGISKAFASTGVRVGWALGPEEIIKPMSNILGHIGAWAPKPEQIAVADFLNDSIPYYEYNIKFVNKLHESAKVAYDILSKIPYIKVVEPEGGIYLSVNFNIPGYTSDEEIRSFLLNEVNIGLIPFQAFGAKKDTGWFRMSIGSVSKEQIIIVLNKLNDTLLTIAGEKINILIEDRHTLLSILTDKLIYEDEIPNSKFTHDFLKKMEIETYYLDEKKLSDHSTEKLILLYEFMINKTVLKKIPI